MGDAPTSPNESQVGPPNAPAIYGFPKDAAGLLPWSHAESRLEQARNFWLASSRADGTRWRFPQDAG